MMGTKTATRLFNVMAESRKIRLASIAFLVIAGTYMGMNIEKAHGQFSTEGMEGTVYTTEDIRSGKSDHLFQIVEFDIISESMLPVMEVGQTAIMNKSVDFMDLEVDDIIVFQCDDIDKLVTHRVINVDDFEDGSRAVATQGDNNDGQLECEEKIQDYRYVGKVIVDVIDASEVA